MPARKVVYTYEVDGRRDFPIDMLRYDRATPAHEEDSYAIARTMGHGIITGPITVHLRSEREPTVGRWKSFGWTVVPESVKALRT